MEKSPKNKKYILMIAATPFFSDRGCHVRIYNEIKYLKKEGIETTLCTYHLGNSIEGFDIQRSVSVPWYNKITPGASWHKLYIDFFLLLTTIKVYFQKRPADIHAHLYEGLLIGFFVKILALGKPKLIFDCQGSLAEEMYAYTLSKKPYLKPLYPIFVFLEKLFLFLPNEIVCSSENAYTILKNKYKVPLKKLHIVQDAVDDTLFVSPTEEEKKIARKNLGIKDDSKVILYTGSITEAKGVKELLEAIPDIVSQDTSIVFVFAGYGSLLEEYKKKLAGYIDLGNVFFFGRFSYFDLARYIAIADFAIDPKKDSSESSGKLFNYMSGGLPVICFRSNFTVSVLGESGYYISSFVDILRYISEPVGYTQNVIQKKGILWKKEIIKLLNLY